MAALTPPHRITRLEDLTLQHLKLIIPNCYVLTWTPKYDSSYLRLSTSLNMATCISHILIEQNIGSYLFHVKYELRDSFNKYQSEGRFSFSITESLPSEAVRKMCQTLNEFIWENESGYQEHLSKIQARVKAEKQKEERSGFFGFFRFATENRLKALEDKISRLERNASLKRYRARNKSL